MVYNNSGTFSIWSSWNGNGENILTSSMISADKCVIPAYCAVPTAKFETITNAPCNFTKGQGLYMLLTNPSNTLVSDPNQYPNINRMPAIGNFFTTGLWNSTGMYQNGSLASGYLGAINPTYTNGEAYFKILDRYYDDNSGAFFVSLKKGFATIVQPPIAKIISTVMAKLNLASNALFLRITNNTDYHKALKALLSIYMIVYGILYSTGTISMSQKELLNMMIKLIIVIQLLTTSTSWGVFNGYFFSFFTQGIAEIIDIVTFNVTNGSGGLTFFDNVLSLLFSYETTIKIFALLVSFPCGIVVIAMIYVAFALFAIAIAKAVMLYLLAYLVISLLISLAPIFITLMLFKTTRSIFDTWINLFASYFFQPVLVFASLALLYQTIMNQMYKLLGFKVCYVPYLYVGNMVILKMWKICSFNSDSAVQAAIPVPGYGFWDALNPTRFCAPYDCIANRYIDLPFLDLTNDSALISAFNSPYIGLNLPMLYNAFLLLLLTYLMLKFNDLIPALAKGIAGTGGGVSPDLGVAAERAVLSIPGGIRDTSSMLGGMAMAKFKKTKAGQKYDKFRENFNKYNQAFMKLKNPGNDADIPDDQKLGIFKVMGHIGKAAHFLARVAIPPGSLSSKRLEEVDENYKAEMEALRSKGIGVTDYGARLQDKFIEVMNENSTIKHGLTNEVQETFRDKREDIKRTVAEIYSAKITQMKEAAVAAKQGAISAAATAYAGARVAAVATTNVASGVYNAPRNIGKVGSALYNSAVGGKGPGFSEVMREFKDERAKAAALANEAPKSLKRDMQLAADNLKLGAGRVIGLPGKAYETSKAAVTTGYKATRAVASGIWNAPDTLKTAGNNLKYNAQVRAEQASLALQTTASKANQAVFGEVEVAARKQGRIDRAAIKLKVAKNVKTGKVIGGIADKLKADMASEVRKVARQEAFDKAIVKPLKDVKEYYSKKQMMARNIARDAERAASTEKMHQKFVETKAAIAKPFKDAKQAVFGEAEVAARKQGRIERAEARQEWRDETEAAIAKPLKDVKEYYSEKQIMTRNATRDAERAASNEKMHEKFVATKDAIGRAIKETEAYKTVAKDYKEASAALQKDTEPLREYLSRPKAKKRKKDSEEG